MTDMVQKLAGRWGQLLSHLRFCGAHGAAPHSQTVVAALLLVGERAVSVSEAREV